MISTAAFLWLAAFGLILASFAAVGGKVMHEIPWHELEDHCRRKKRRDIFDAIHDSHDEVALGVESLQILGAALFFISALGSIVSSDGTRLTADWWMFSLWTAVGVLLLLAVGVWIPGAIARLWAAPFLYRTWRFWSFSRILLRPSLAGAHLVERLLRRLAGREEHPSEEEAFEEEIRTIVTEGLHDGLLEADAREMIEGVIELGDADVADIMTPRSKMDAISVDLDWSEAMRQVIRCGRTRIPVYSETLDNIVGILYVKDLLPELTKDLGQHGHSLRKILRQSWSVPKTRRVDNLLQDFLQTRNHMAIVVDEYMAVAGLVTIEDVLEEIVGEIVDESDKEHIGEIRSIDDVTAEVQGRAHLTEVNEQLGLDLQESEDLDTIGGLVILHLGRIPHIGETIQLNNVRITVLEASRRKVERVRLEILQHTGRESA